MDKSKLRKYNLSSTYKNLFKQYPHQAPNESREHRASDNKSPSDYNSRRELRNYDEGVVIASNGSRKESETGFQEQVNHSIAEDFQYQDDRRPSLPSQVGTPEVDQPPMSPTISDIDSPREPRRRNLDAYSSRTRYDPMRASQDDLHVQGNHQRSRSQHSSSNQRPESKSRRPAPDVRILSGSRSQSESPPTPNTVTEHNLGPGERSSAESIYSHETAATSVNTLPALQTKGPDNSDVQQLDPVVEDDPRSWDLVEPMDESSGPTGMYAMERRSEQMFSSEHLRIIFNDPKLLLKFTGFLNSHRPKSIAILIYYLDALKALRAIDYANAIAEALEPIRGHEFTQQVAPPTKNGTLEEKADRAFEILVREDLAAFISHLWIQVVSVSIQKRITGTLAPHLREASEGLAEVFCLTDPSRADNPIVFASEEFVRTTQYGMNYVIGRNCRFLQGPRTNPHSVRRLKDAVVNTREHNEVLINYRRDGSPFMNLLMTAPLMDSRGNVRYYIGAQVDVSNLVKECSNLDGLMRIVEKEQDHEGAKEEEEASRKDEFQELTEMFNSAELETVRRNGGRMHKEYADDTDTESVSQGRRRVVLKDASAEILEKHGGSSAAASMPPAVKEKVNGKLEGVYQNVSNLPALQASMELIASTVPTNPTGTVATNSLHFAIAPCSRHTAVAIP